jgi:hypothetical protein
MGLMFKLTIIRRKEAYTKLEGICVKAEILKRDRTGNSIPSKSGECPIEPQFLSGNVMANRHVSRNIIVSGRPDIMITY